MKNDLSWTRACRPTDEGTANQTRACARSKHATSLDMVVRATKHDDNEHRRSPSPFCFYDGAIPSRVEATTKDLLFCYSLRRDVSLLYEKIKPLIDTFDISGVF
jgi:hypothetical protein